MVMKSQTTLQGMYFILRQFYLTGFIETKPTVELDGRPNKSG